jgi:hypothetical protein
MCIVTNSDTGWIELTSQKYMPKLYSYLTKLDTPVNIVSAKSQYADKCINDPDNSPTKWKYLAFGQVINHKIKPEHLRNTSISIVSIGDSNFERTALLCLKKTFTNAICKSITTTPCPSPIFVANQVKFLSSKWIYIHHEQQHLDLMLTLPPVTCI